MRRGATTPHTFVLPFDTSLVKSARICYAQLGRPLFVKTGDDVSFSGNEIKTQLTQEDTLAFNCAHDVEIQLRVLTKAGDVPDIDLLKVPVKRCLDTEVMV